MGNAQANASTEGGSRRQNSSNSERRGSNPLRSLRPRAFFGNHSHGSAAIDRDPVTPDSLEFYHSATETTTPPRARAAQTESSTPRRRERASAPSTPLQTPSPNRAQHTPVHSIHTNANTAITTPTSPPAFTSQFPDFIIDTDESHQDFYPTLSLDWRFRSLESLVLGHTSRAPILSLEDYDNFALADPFEDYCRRRSTASTFGGRRRSSAAGGGRRGSLSLHGGTMASYQHRSRATADTFERATRRGSTQPMYRRRSSLAATGGANGSAEASRARRNMSVRSVLHSVLARETTGKSPFPRGVHISEGLLELGGTPLFQKFDGPSGNIASEVSFLSAAIDSGDWTEVQTLVTRLAPRLIGDPSSSNQTVIDDPNIPPTAPRFHAGGGLHGLERDTFVHAGGVQVLIRIFREKAFVGMEMAMTNDARDLSREIISMRLSPCWNEVLVSLRELVYRIPSIVEDGTILSNGDFLPFLFTLLSHEHCFDTASDLIEEIISAMASCHHRAVEVSGGSHAMLHQTPLTFYLGHVPDLYSLWRNFSCRQLARFCRILALLIFEPEDRQLLESPSVLKSIDLLRLRRSRAVRAGMDSTVDLNQAIVLGDDELMARLVGVIKMMNYAPPLHRFSPYHVLSHFPFIVDTLTNLGLNEVQSFAEIDRLDGLARELLSPDPLQENSQSTLCELGNVAEMLDRMSESLGNTGADEVGTFSINHIVALISAAHQTGVIGDSSEGAIPFDLGSLIEENPLQGFAAVAGLIAGTVRVSRLNSGEDMAGLDEIEAIGIDESARSRYLGNQRTRPPASPQEAANLLQFNGILLGPFQVEVLFVLCTLLGGRRKLDAQDCLGRHSLPEVLNDMFVRLPFGGREGNDGRRNLIEHQQHGPHGPGCDCTPESTLCVQYLRLVYNFCDRDCDNYSLRYKFLSSAERDLALNQDTSVQHVESGLLTKLVRTFISESDESPYRFWLSSCIESYLRGSSQSEQMFLARIGLLDHLLKDISSDRLHCAGSLQTSFDLLGELTKGNHEVLKILVSRFDEDKFRKFMSVAAANLVDSNVFIRSLFVTLESLTLKSGDLPLHSSTRSHRTPPKSTSSAHIAANESFMYLTHSWLDTESFSIDGSPRVESSASMPMRAAEWYPSFSLDILLENPEEATSTTGLEENVGQYGWLFCPTADSVCPEALNPNSLERLSWFLSANQGRLLRDLLRVVDLRNINHENVCCLNTAVIVAIFANRRRCLQKLVSDLRQMNTEELKDSSPFTSPDSRKDVVDSSFAHAKRNPSLTDAPSYARSVSASFPNTQLDTVKNFREVLWFWQEYYSHRGRDRLSLEFSSHIRFQEWNHVVKLLVRDDGSPTALLRTPIRLPRSPYDYAPRFPGDGLYRAE